MKALLCFLFVFFLGCGDDENRMYDITKPNTIHIFGNSMMAWNNHGVRRELDELLNTTPVSVEVETVDGEAEDENTSLGIFYYFFAKRGRNFLFG